jgi:hypothetical protein
MATFNIPITCDNTTGSTNFRIKYRLAGDSVWTMFLIAPSSATTVTIPQDSPTSVLDNNRIYDFQVQNLNGSDNPLSLIVQSIGITDPGVVFSPTNISVGFEFENLSVDIDSYLITLSTVEDPSTIIATQTLSTGNVYPQTMTGTFSSLSPLTAYRFVISPAANQFTESFVYTFITEATETYPNVISVTATLS